MIDVHCHLQFKAFTKDYQQVIKNAFSEGVTVIINTGTSLESSINATEFTKLFENMYAIIGIHPHHSDKLENGWQKELKKLAVNKKVVGIGEIGIDYYSYLSNGIVNPDIQKKVFEEQIALAKELDLPIQIHNRHAGKDVIEILSHHKNLLKQIPGMFHCFASTREVLKKALDMGFYIGFDGNITYKGLAPGETVELSELALLTPLERIVLETDSPYLTPVPLRGQRNEPKNVKLIAQHIAKIKGISFEEVIEQTDKNVYTIFKLI